MLIPAAAAADLGLQTLIAVAAADDVVNRNVATRTISASRRAVCCCLGGGDRDPEVFKEEDAESGDEEGGDDDAEGRGCWVTYGWRRRRLHRLPPLIPSLRRAGSSPWALTRTRTADGRVVVLREPAPRRGHVVARRMEGRLILDLVHSSPVPPPPPPHHRRTHSSIAQEVDAPATEEPTDDEEEEEEEEEEDTASGAYIASARGRDVPAMARAAILVSSSPVGSASPVQAVGCFEAVIRTSPLRKMSVSLPRMVH